MREVIMEMIQVREVVSYGNGTSELMIVLWNTFPS